MTITEASAAHQVAIRYIELVNAGDLDGVVALFQPGATLLHPLGEFVGQGPIRSFYADNILPRRVRLTALSFVDDGPCCVFELEAQEPAGTTYATDHLALGREDRIQRLAIYYR